MIDLTKHYNNLTSQKVVLEPDVTVSAIERVYNTLAEVSYCMLTWNLLSVMLLSYIGPGQRFFSSHHTQTRSK